MTKLLVNAPSGQQEVIEIGKGGGYFDQVRVLWDERIDGPMPAITLGGMVRVGQALEYSQAQMDEHNTASAQTAKSAKWEAIKAERARRLNAGGFPHGGHWYHSDQEMTAQFLGLKLKALETLIAGGDMGANIQIEGVDAQIKTMDNGYVAVTGTQILAIVAVGEVQMKRTYGSAIAHKLAMEASPDPAAYDYISTGWPAIYAP